ncbi:MAG: hypothetical protein LBR47_01850 [Spirochaetaceae bacterium]|jgi:hypothetical protein|nr:hypothetical protein [Spirochaetaceae bacterium]
MDDEAKKTVRRKLVDVLHTTTSLTDLESGIRHICGNVVQAKKEVCHALGRIQKEKLYRQAGFEDFKSYLRANRVPFAYSTAVEYARIGIALDEYRQKLEEISFSDEKGLKKLGYLPQALKNYPDEEAMIFEKLKCSSVREFSEYARVWTAERSVSEKVLPVTEPVPVEERRKYTEDSLHRIITSFRTSDRFDPALLPGIRFVLEKLENYGIISENAREDLFSELEETL